MRQKVFNVICPKCSTTFDAHSYAVFEVEVPVMHPELRAEVIQIMSITAAPCPECNCGSPIDNATPYKWEKYED